MFESFDYELPQARIAAWPSEATSGDRASSRLLVASVPLSIRDHTFHDLPAFLQPGDLLVLNNSRVNKRRLFAHHERAGREVELFVFRESTTGECEALARPARRLKSGDIVVLSTGARAEILGRGEGGDTVRFQIAPVVPGATGATGDVAAILESAGVMPIPPYIRSGRAEKQDESFYQNVFAKTPGSVAAPTAGLHFTEKLLEDLRQRGVGVAYVTLHVGLWSIVPNGSRTSPTVGAEQYLFPASLHQQILRTKAAGKRVIAVGTTSCRVLESIYRLGRPAEIDSAAIAAVADQFAETTLAISPGFQFNIVDGLITNFHQSGSTHLALVSAFFGSDNMRAIYEHALAKEYMFLSYGDGMLLQPQGAA